jgi:hypothetical protein
MAVVGTVAIGRCRVGRRQLGSDSGRRPRTAGSGSGSGWRGGAIATFGARGIHAGGTQDLVDDVGLLAPGICVERHRIGYRPKLFALFAL